MKQTDMHSELLTERPVAPKLSAQSVQASASGKAIIVGEHAVVYGARAVAMPINSLQMNVRLTVTQKYDKNGQPQVRMLIGGRPVTAHLRGVIDDAFTVLGLEPFPLDMEAHSTVMIGAGLGSSASLCVVILKAIAATVGMPMSRFELANFANQLERRFHGNPSGLDTAAVAMGHAISFAKGGTPTELAVAAPAGHESWRFALLDSGVRSSTLTMIQVAAPYFQGSLGEQRLAAFDSLAESTARGLTLGDQGIVAESMKQAGAWLTEAGVVSDALTELINAATNLGCPAAKSTGAGGGGCVLALLNREHADAQLVALRELLGGTKVCAVELR
ncbi:MAG: mevalonate kinase [Proteobacteria bacterium]|nr:mevalonate kinase [Pseudomonadota bacterium]